VLDERSCLCLTLDLGSDGPTRYPVKRRRRKKRKRRRSGPDSPRSWATPSAVFIPRYPPPNDLQLESPALRRGQGPRRPGGSLPATGRWEGKFSGKLALFRKTGLVNGHTVNCHPDTMWDALVEKRLPWEVQRSEKGEKGGVGPTALQREKTRPGLPEVAPHWWGNLERLFSLL